MLCCRRCDFFPQNCGQLLVKFWTKNNHKLLGWKRFLKVIHIKHYFSKPVFFQTKLIIYIKFHFAMFSILACGNPFDFWFSLMHISYGLQLCAIWKDITSQFIWMVVLFFFFLSTVCRNHLNTSCNQWKLFHHRNEYCMYYSLITRKYVIFMSLTLLSLDLNSPISSIYIYTSPNLLEKC